MGFVGCPIHRHRILHNVASKQGNCFMVKKEKKKKVREWTYDFISTTPIRKKLT